MPEKKFRITRTANHAGKQLYELCRFDNGNWVGVSSSYNKEELDDLVTKIVEAEKMEPVYYDEDGKLIT